MQGTTACTLPHDDEYKRRRPAKKWVPRLAQLYKTDSPSKVLDPLLFFSTAYAFCSCLAVLPLPPPLFLAVSVLLATYVPTSSANETRPSVFDLQPTVHAQAALAEQTQAALFPITVPYPLVSSHLCTLGACILAVQDIHFLVCSDPRCPAVPPDFHRLAGAGAHPEDDASSSHVPRGGRSTPVPQRNQFANMLVYSPSDPPIHPTELIHTTTD